MRPLSRLFFEKTIREFDNISKNEWICFAKSNSRICNYLHDELANIAKTNLTKIMKKVALKPKMIFQIKSNKIIEQ